MTDADLPVVVAAGVLVRRGDAVLLQRRRDDDTWGLPGGGLHPGETLEQTARRELLEETGLTAGVLTLVDVYSGPEFVVSYLDGFTAYVVGATYATDDVEGEPVADGDGDGDGDETLELRWFDGAHLPRDINDYNRALLARAGVTARGHPSVTRTSTSRME